MPDPHAHYRLVYTCRKTGARTVSMTHITVEKAKSMRDMLNYYARKGSFGIEDEHEQAQAA